jgi:hypothetical protein
MDAIERLVRLIEYRTDNETNDLRRQINDMAADNSRYIQFPLSLAENYTVTAGNQQVLSTLTIEAGYTLTVNGRLEILHELVLDGTLDGTGELW